MSEEMASEQVVSEVAAKVNAQGNPYGRMNMFAQWPDGSKLEVIIEGPGATNRQRQKMTARLVAAINAASQVT